MASRERKEPATGFAVAEFLKRHLLFFLAELLSTEVRKRPCAADISCGQAKLTAPASRPLKRTCR
jgi:hypothetical protein